VPVTFEELLEKGKLWYPEGRPMSFQEKQSVVSLGLTEVDSALASGGLARGAIHEFCCAEPAETKLQGNENIFKVPLGIFAALAVRSAFTDRTSAAAQKYTLWIGKSCWPNPAFIRNFLPASKAKAFLSHSLFIDPPDEKKFLWSIEAALRSPAVATVAASLVAEFKNIPFPLSRRLSLSAKSAGTIGIIAVSTPVLRAPSAAATRWRIRPVVSPSEHPRFELSLLKQKGGPVPADPWVCELVDDGEKISFNIPADVVGEPGAAKAGEYRKEKVDQIRRRA